jgi:hypothetical protein
LPVFHIQSIERREGDSFYDEVIYEQPYDDLSSTKIRVNINQEQVKRALNAAKIGCYLEFNFSCYACNKGDSDDDENIAHSMLAYEAENGKYIFFDPKNANSGLRKEESIGNGGLFGFHEIGNESRKDVNQEINRRSMASMFNFKSIFEVAKNRLNDGPFSQ